MLAACIPEITTTTHQRLVVRLLLLTLFCPTLRPSFLQPCYYGVGCLLPRSQGQGALVGHFSARPGDANGLTQTLLARNYRGDIPMSAVEKFPVLLSEAEDESSAVPPCFSSEGINYLYIRHNNLYLLAITKRNTNAAEILLFLHRIVEVFTEYFKELEEESIRDNFVVIYELLDEMMDFGYPQTTESKILQEYDPLPHDPLVLC